MPYKYDRNQRFLGDYAEDRLEPKIVNRGLNEKLRPPHTPWPSVRETTGAAGAMREEEIKRRTRDLLPSRFTGSRRKSSRYEE